MGKIRKTSRPDPDQFVDVQIFMDAIPGVAMLIETETRLVVAVNKVASTEGIKIGAACTDQRLEAKGICSACRLSQLRETGKSQRSECETGGVIRDSLWMPITRDLCLCCSFDITRRKKAEEALREVERELRDSLRMSDDLLRATPSGIYIYEYEEPDKLFLVDANKAAEELAGIKLCDWKGKEFDEIWPTARGAGLTDIYLNVARTGKIFEREDVRYKDDRVNAVFRVRAFKLPNSRLAIAFENVTERLEREVELRKLSRAVEQSPATVLITDSDGVIEYVNPVFTELTGYLPKEVVGKPPRILKSGEQSRAFYKQMWDTIKSGKVWRGEVCNKKKNGELYWESASISPIKNERGKITHFVAVKEDITKRKKMEERLREKSRALMGRVRELRCLYGIARITAKNLSLEETLRVIVQLIPPAWRYPGIAHARIRMYGREFVSDGFKKSAWTQEAEVRIAGERIGTVEVFYTVEKPELDEGPFLKEERTLLNGIRNLLCDFIKRNRAEGELIEGKKALEEKNIALREVVAQVEEEKNKIKGDVATNVEENILPILSRLKAGGVSQKWVTLLRRNLKSLSSSFSRDLTAKSGKLTPRELEICGMIKGGLSSKDISNLLGTALQTVEKQRKTIRKKLKLKSKTNLTAYLQKV